MNDPVVTLFLPIDQERYRGHKCIERVRGAVPVGGRTMAAQRVKIRRFKPLPGQLWEPYTDLAIWVREGEDTEYLALVRREYQRHYTRDWRRS